MAENERVLELCRLLVGLDRPRILQAIERFEEKPQLAEHLSAVLGDAVRLGAARDERLRDALAPLVSQGVRDTVERDPVTFGKALAPAMGPAIRQAVRQMFQSLVEGFERTLEVSFSPRGWKWRFEAWRTGKSFAEVVFLHTLRFRVEHAFLIHHETGLLLLHAAKPNVKSRSADLVSAMLTAIQDFVADAFEAGDGDGLGEFQVGDCSVWVERGQRAVLAAVIRGQAPRSLRGELRSAIEEIELGFARPLAEFDGDPAAFEIARPLLERCLAEQLRDDAPRERRRRDLGLPLTLVAGIAVALLGWCWLASHREQSRWDDFLGSLRTAPGIAVTQARRDGERLVVSGLRDPLAADPAALAAAAGLDPGRLDMRWEAFHSGHPSFVIARLERALEPPPGVAFEVYGRTLRVRGRAPLRWIERLNDYVRFVPSIEALDAGGLIGGDR
jgi:OOP family OmpA-OmpF porin